MFAPNQVPYNRSKGRDYIVWVDLECTGKFDDGNGNRLPDNGILEIGAVITDRALNEVDAKQIVLPITSKMEESMVPFVTQMHTANGLLDDCHQVAMKGDDVFIMPEKMFYDQAVGEADKELAAWIKSYNGSHHMPIGGSGVAWYDMRFIEVQLPKFTKRVTHFVMELGAVRRFMELAGIQLTADYFGATMDKPHRALDDARIHVEEARRWIMWAQDRVRI